PSSPSAALQTLTALPPKLLQLHATLVSLPPLSTLPAPQNPAGASSVSTLGGLTEPGKRVWETSQTGYVNWALGRLLVRSVPQGQGQGSSSQGSSGPSSQGEEEGAAASTTGQGIVDRIDHAAAQIGSGEDLRSALEVIEGVRRELDEALRRGRSGGAVGMGGGGAGASNGNGTREGRTENEREEEQGYQEEGSSLMMEE
ncbi:hypothetical protein CVT26_008988, partial [Gymnopilus dilepis]